MYTDVQYMMNFALLSAFLNLINYLNAIQSSVGNTCRCQLISNNCILSLLLHSLSTIILVSSCRQRVRNFLGFEWKIYWKKGAGRILFDNMVVYKFVDYVTLMHVRLYVKLMYNLNLKMLFNVIKLVQFYTLIQINKAWEHLAQDARWVKIERQL
jgi:hypothetical protein